MSGRETLIHLASLAALMAAWAGLAAALGDPQRLPSPWAVALRLGDLAQSGALALHLGATLARVAVAFGAAMLLGSLLGLWLGRHPRLDRWAAPWVTVFLNLPALVVIVLCYLWIGLTETAAVVAVAVNKTAMVLVSLREGTRTLDPGLDEMARVFRLSPLARLRHVVLPQLAPWLAAAARNGLAVIWKIVLVAEFLGRSDGVGFQIHLQFQLFDITGVLAWALAFVAVILAIEVAVLRPWERQAVRWRAAAG